MMSKCKRIGEGVVTAPPPHERKEKRVRSIEFDHEAARAELIGSASSEYPDRPRWTELKVWFLHNPPQHGRPWLSEVYGCSRVAGETARIQRLNVGSLDRALKLFADSDIGVVASEEARDWEEQNVRGRVGDVTILNGGLENLLAENGVKVTMVRNDTFNVESGRLGDDEPQAPPELIEEARAHFRQAGLSGALGKDELRAILSSAPEIVDQMASVWRDPADGSIGMSISRMVALCPLSFDDVVSALYRSNQNQIIFGMGVDILGPAVPSDDAAALEWLYGETDGGKATFASMLAKDFDLAPRTVTTALASNTPIRIPLRAALRFFDRAAFRAWRKREKADG